MDLKELITFRTIIQEGTFAKAADKLHYAQSTVTNQIQRLEKELGFKLFIRGWEAQLTEAGKVYAAEADSLITHWQQVMNQARQIEKEETGTLRIGMTENVAYSLLSEVFQQLAIHKPGIQLELTIGNTDLLQRAVKDRLLDIAVCGEPYALDSLSFQLLYKEHISFIVDHQHPLASQKILSPDDLLKFPLIVGGQHCLYHIQLEKEFSRLHIQPFIHIAGQLSMVALMTTAIRGIGVVLASTPVEDSIVRIEFPMQHASVPIGWLRQREQTYLPSVQQWFIELISSQVHQNSSLHSSKN